MGYLRLVQYAPTDQEMERERRMDDLLRRFLATKSKPLKKALFTTYRKLHNERSPEFIAWMERERRIDK